MDYCRIDRVSIALAIVPSGNQVPTLVYFHGNAGNIGFRLVNARQMQLAIGCNVLMVDYRG